MRRNMRVSGRSTLCAALVGLAMGVAACGGGDDEAGGGSGGAPAGDAAKETKVGLATIGPKNDKAFSESHWRGLQQAEKEIDGVELTAVLDNREDPQGRIDAFRTLAASNDLIVGASATFAQTAESIAPQFSDKHFIVSSGATEKKLDNVTSIVPDEGLPAYVAGVVMAKLSKTGTIGVLGGAEIPPTEQTIAGVRAGAQAENPDVEVLTNIIGNFNDAAKAKEAAKAMIDDGADQIFGFLDAGVQGLYQAGEESGKEIGAYNIIVQDCSDYENLVGTATLDNGQLMFTAVKDFVAGELEPGVRFVGLEEPELQTLALCPKYEKNDEIKKATQETIDAINNGEIDVPADVLNPRPDYAAGG